MYIDADTVIKLASFLSAVGIIIGILFGFFKWLNKKDRESVVLAELKKHHEDDMKKMQAEHDAKMKEIQGELCMVNYALLAALDGLLQQGCNGEVTKAHTALTKHINKQAHDVQ